MENIICLKILNGYFLILVQRFHVAGAELAEGGIDKAAAGRRPLLDQLEVLRTEKDRIQHPAEVRGRADGDVVDGDPLLFSGAGIDPADKVPVPGADGTLQAEALLLETDQLAVGAGSVGLAGGQADHGLQKIGLPLGVLSADDAAHGVEKDLLGGVVAEVLQLDAVKTHRRAYRSGRRRRLRPPDGASGPAGGRVRR